MKLTDILPLDKWVELEKQIHDIYGLNAAVYNIDGFRITDYKNWANRLCPVIKSNEAGQSSICAVANQHTMAQAKDTKKPVSEECDAGLIKIAIPIFAGDEFLGIAGGCGLLPDGGEVESFLISKTTGIDEEEIEGLSDDIKTMQADHIEKVIEFIKERIDEITGKTE
jgi:ligand-binding sensor protein